jgi:hypothetical protein
MELIFPFRNITINTLWDFFEKEKVKEFSDIKSGKDTWREEYFNNDIARWKDSLPNLENEILQIVNTTDQKTIDEYFNSFIAQLNNLNDCLTKEYFQECISGWNAEILKKYTEAVEKKGEEYSQQENRKRKHLEEYEDWQFSGLFFGFQNSKAEKVKKVNYNFYCIEETPDLITTDVVDEYLELVKPLFNELIEVARKYGKPWQEGKLKSKVEQQFIPKPIIFVEGEHDITLISKAAELLNKKEVLEKVEIRQRGGYRNLDKLWNVLNEESWETTPQTKIFLYDCDTNKTDEDFGNHHKRIIPTNPDSIVMKGIENLFPNDFINKAIETKRAFVDFKKTNGIRRGVEYTEEMNEINKDEKKNFCDWACENGTADDFRQFEFIFKIIEEHV